MSSVVPLALMGREEFRVTHVDADSSGVRVPGSTGTASHPDGSAPCAFHSWPGATSPGRIGEGAPAVAIVNDTLARLFWNGDAVGKRLKYPDVEIVGVVADSKYWTLGETISPTLYRPYRQTRHQRDEPSHPDDEHGRWRPRPCGPSCGGSPLAWRPDIEPMDTGDRGRHDARARGRALHGRVRA